MTVNELIKDLKRMQKQGHGKTAVHITAHDNSEGESQGEVYSCYYYEKEFGDREHADPRLFDSTPTEMVYLGN